jgi:KUP system potassium uptake protein
MTSTDRGPGYNLGLTVGALGVVYGDIGTSPLYAFRECFHGTHAIDVTRGNVLGVLSLILWSLLLIVTVKYLLFVLRMSNKGEGGILALMALAVPDWKLRNSSKSGALMLMLGVFGASLLYGDGMITPAISVLGAVEGLEIATPKLKPYVVPLTALILVLLFSFQRHGTAKVGRVFGPVTFLWFLTIAALGIWNLMKAPEVFAAVNPYHAFQLFRENGKAAFLVLGSVFLVVTGGEALYADMGHFGRGPIKNAWLFVVLPALVLNYLGQGALVLRHPSLANNPFYNMAPEWALYPVVAIATAAAVIASQALISGAFSITMQAIQLGYSPRMEIAHTSSTERGQIYMPKINWVLMLSCVGLVFGFQNSSNLAGAYGIAVTLTMLITTVLFYVASRRIWRWSFVKAASLCALFFAVELCFFGANALKLFQGGWFPLMVAAIIVILMSTWKTGRTILGNRLRSSVLPIDVFLKDIEEHPVHRVRGTAVFLSSNPNGTPLALMHNLKHNQVLHERVVILTIQTVEVPHVDPAERVEVEELACGFHRVIGRFGFMEDPDVPQVFAVSEARGFKLEPGKTTYFLSRETIIASDKPGMFMWRERLFAFMSRNAQSATAFFHLPPNRVVELGMQVEI